MSNTKYPLQLTLDEKAFNTFERLERAVGASSFAEVVRHAIGLLEWARAQHEQGLSLGAFKRDHLVKEVALPFVAINHNTHSEEFGLCTSPPNEK